MPIGMTRTGNAPAEERLCPRSEAKFIKADIREEDEARGYLA